MKRQLLDVDSAYLSIHKMGWCITESKSFSVKELDSIRFPSHTLAPNHMCLYRDNSSSCWLWRSSWTTALGMLCGAKRTTPVPGTLGEHRCLSTCCQLGLLACCWVISLRPARVLTLLSLPLLEGRKHQVQALLHFGRQFEAICIHFGMSDSLARYEISWTYELANVHSLGWITL